MTIAKLTQKTFTKEVLEDSSKILVDFYADWCGPCNAIKPIIEEIARNNAKIKIKSVNIDDEDELAEEYDVSSIPCLIVFENGKEINRRVGLMSKAEIEEMIGE